MNLHSFLEIISQKTGKTAKKSGTGYSTCCPAHEDTTPSLSISEGSDGKILLHCFAGCTVKSICEKLGIDITDLFVMDFKKEPHRTIYSYQDEGGQELYRKVRTEPGLNGKSKGFHFEHDDAMGQTIYNLQGCRKVLYHLPQLLKGIADNNPIYLVEGEKEADKLSSYGLIATTAPESLKWLDTFIESLKGADVVILYDMDKTGIERKNLLCKALYEQVKRLRVIDLPGIEYQESHGKDISDWLAEGHTTDDLIKIVTSTLDYFPSTQKTRLRAVTMKDFLQMQLPKREMILDPFLPSQGLCLLYAKRGVGKTHVALGIAYAVATGGTFLKFRAPKPKKVLYIDGEMPASAMQERLQRIALNEELQPHNPQYLRLITPDLQEEAMPDLGTKEGRSALDELINDCDLIIIDNISTLFRSGVENEAESWQPVQDWALELRKKGKSVLFIHHAAKTGQQRGTSKREDILDCVISLKQSQNHCANEGAAFEVIFEKTRHFTGDDAASFQVQLREQDDGLWQWKIEEPEIDSEIEQVAKAVKEGLTIEEIKQRTGLTKSQIETRKNKAKNQGLI